MEEKTPSIGNIHFDDTQEIQVHQDYCTQLCQFVAMNRSVLEQLQNIKRFFTCDEHLSEDIKSLRLCGLLADAKEQLRRLETLLKRLDGTLGLVIYLRSFRILLT